MNSLQRLLLVLNLGALLSFAATGVADARKTTRPKLKLADKSMRVSAPDTIRAVPSGIRLSGFEKAQYSTKESLFITNATDTNFTGISITVEYLDMKGRQLHKRSLPLTIDLPRGDTRQAVFTSWDTQKLWYYHHTQGRHNAYSTPFDVKINIDYLLVTDSI